MFRIRNGLIRGISQHDRRFGDKVREAILRLLGCVLRRDSELISRRMPRFKVAGRRPEERLEDKKIMGVMKEDRKLASVRECRWMERRG